MNWVWSAMLATSVGISCMYYIRWKSRDIETPTVLPQIAADDGKEREEKEKKVTKRELRYQDFASVMYEGEMYMSPKDFLESVTQDEPRSAGYQVMDDRILSKIIKDVPPLSKGSSHFFRDLWNDGILTYADYLFLLTALIKPRKQFEIVFRMIDVDGNDTVDLEEFEQMQKTVTRRRNTTSVEQSKLRQSTLITHLFGSKGNKKLSSNDLFKFIDDLQTEVRDMEFNKYSLGGPTINAEQFAEILLQHTNYDLQEVRKRLHREHEISDTSISFEQYSDFCQLLSALDDFQIAMTMFTIAGKPVSEDEFSRASQVAIGKSLDTKVIHTVFKIFDLDGDGKLSDKEFISVMKNWQVRGMKLKQTKREGVWAEFKTCVKLEMRNQ